MDFELQAFAESLMIGRRGAVVAIDPATGGILAMVSKPDYDLSLFSGVTSPELWRALNEDESRPLFNRATLTRYRPGSTFKMTVALAALEHKVVSPTWRVNCSGAFRFGNKVFKDLGFTNVQEAEDGVDALNKLRGEEFEFVVTDWNMPGMQGIDLLKAVRADANLKDLPVLMVTAEAKREQIVEAAQAGVNGYVVKPFTAQTLKEKIDKIFERIEANQG